MSFQNPFLQLSADRYSVQTTIRYFEEAPSWGELHKARNQVVFGHYGSGKSIALQRLRASAMARKPRFAIDTPFIGIYLNMLDVAFLDSIAALAQNASLREKWDDISERAERIKQRYIAVSLLQSAATEMTEVQASNGFGPLLNPRELARRLALIGGYNEPSISGFRSVVAAAAEERSKIKRASESMNIFTSGFATDGHTNLQLIGHSIAEVISAPGVFRQFPEGLPTYFLIDQIEAVDRKTKERINLLTRRENPFFCKIASRVHGHTNTSSDGKILRIGEDVFPVFAGFTMGETAGFAALAAAVAEKMLHAYGDTRSLQELLAGSRRHSNRAGLEVDGPIYAGVETLAALASGSMRAFLEMCSLAVRCAQYRGLNVSRTPLPPDCQTQAAVALARQELERLSTSDSALGPRVRAMVEQLYRKIRGNQELMPVNFKLAGDLFPDDALGEDLRNVIKGGFELDAFRYLALEDTTYGEIPEAFAIAQVFAPAFGVSVRRVGTRHITPDELKNMASTFRGRAQQQQVEPEKQPKLFYSTSFANRPVTDAQTRMIRDVFATEFAVVMGDSATSGNQLNKIYRSINDANVVLVEVSAPTPSVMLELGISYALKKRTFIMFNRDSDADLSALQAFIRTLDIITYSFDVEHLKVARDKIVQRFQTEPDAGELMEVNAFGQRLRPRTEANTVFMYNPANRPVWRSMRDRLRDHIVRLGGRLITTESAPNNSTTLESVMFAVNRSSREFRTSCIIDSTGKEGPDLVGSFALGAAFALRRGVVRIEEAGHANERALGLWPSPYEVWSNEQELFGILSRYITRKGKADSRAPRKRK